jgi:hypothetical protein
MKKELKLRKKKKPYLMRKKILSTKFLAKLKTIVLSKERSTNSRNNFYNLNNKSRMMGKRSKPLKVK